MDKGSKRLLTQLSAISIAIVIPVLLFTSSTISKVTEIKGVCPLRASKNIIMKVLGKPISPPDFDLFYMKNGVEIIVCFDEKTKLASCIIVKGKAKGYLVGGVALGDSKSLVKKVFGDPEIKRAYGPFIECWYYPSKNVNFAFDEDQKVYSFSVSDTYEQYLKK
jgi:hypothetical protein